MHLRAVPIVDTGYNKPIVIMPGGSGGNIQDKKNSALNNGMWANNLTQFANNALQLYNQQRLTNENFERARQGREQLTAQDLVNTPFAIDDGTRNNGLLLLGLGVGAVLLFTFMGKRRTPRDEPDEGEE